MKKWAKYYYFTIKMPTFAHISRVLFKQNSLIRRLTICSERMTYVPFVSIYNHKMGKPVHQMVQTFRKEFTTSWECAIYIPRQE